MIVLKIDGVYFNKGKMVFAKNKIIEWNELSSEKPKALPSGSSLELTISFDENDFLLGNNGIVWATYDLRQAEIIHSSLLAQHVNSEVKTIDLNEGDMFLIKITNETEINNAIDFIWRANSGLRLKPDWSYTNGEANKSFELWLSGH